MNNLQNNKEVQKLIKKGIKQTFLTLEEIQETMETTISHQMISMR